MMRALPENNILSSATPVDWHRRFDLVIRCVLALIFALFAGFYFRNAMSQLRQFDPAHIDAHSFVHGFSVFAIGLYTFMLASVYVLRLRPVNRFAGVWPCIAALLGGFLVLGLLLLEPRTDLPLPVQAGASLLVLIGEGFSVYALSNLGRSFSILPESRRLVTTGPYKIVRHPLYLAEAVATLGAMISFLSVSAILIVAAQFALQLVRIHYEERVLRETFPEYTDYARHTARLMPGIY